MSGLAKGMIICVVVVVVIILMGVGAGVYWISRQGGPLLARGKDAMEEGRRVGKSTDNDGCVAAEVERYKKEPGFSAAITSQIFLQGCLRASRATEGFCDTVPGPMEISKSVKWQMEQCSRHGLAGDSYCGQLFSPIQQFCNLKKTDP